MEEPQKNEEIPSQAVGNALESPAEGSQVKLEANEQTPTDSSEPTTSEEANEPIGEVAAEAKADEVSDAIKAVAQSLEASRAEIATVKSAIDASNRDIIALRDAVSGNFKETTDRMHEKLQRYDRGLEASLRKPVIDEIIAICDEVEKNVRDVGDDAESALKRLRELPEFIKTSLYNLGIEEYTVESGVEKFNPRRHRGLKPVPTDDDSLDGVVCEVFRTGFASDVGTEKERPFRTAWVSVYKKQKQENKEN